MRDELKEIVPEELGLKELQAMGLKKLCLLVVYGFEEASWHEAGEAAFGELARRVTPKLVLGVRQGYQAAVGREATGDEIDEAVSKGLEVLFRRELVTGKYLLDRKSGGERDERSLEEDWLWSVWKIGKNVVRDRVKTFKRRRNKEEKIAKVESFRATTAIEAQKHGLAKEEEALADRREKAVKWLLEELDPKLRRLVEFVMDGDWDHFKRKRIQEEFGMTEREVHAEIARLKRVTEKKFREGGYEDIIGWRKSA